MMRFTLLAALAAAILAQPALAEKRLDLSGYWGPTQGRIPPDPGLMAKLPANTAVLDDTGISEFPQGEYGGLKLTPKAQEVARTWKPTDDMTISRACLPPSIVYATQGPFPFEIYQGTELMVFKYEYFDQVRVIFMDGRGHPGPDYPHSKTGHSIGHWEGDELVVDTTHLATATITNNGLFHGENVHAVERFKLSADGTTLLSTMWFEDPEMLENKGARFIAWRKQPGEAVYPYECDPSFGANYAK